MADFETPRLEIVLEFEHLPSVAHKGIHLHGNIYIIPGSKHIIAFSQNVASLSVTFFRIYLWNQSSHEKF